MNNNLKKILVIGPVLPQHFEIKFISESLDFLLPEYQIDFYDPLENLTVTTRKDDFFSNWKSKIKNVIDDYHAFIGFSLGGVILQKSFPDLENKNKRVILISTPLFSDNLLFKRLSTVIDLVNNKSVLDSINKLNEYVSYPFQSIEVDNVIDSSITALRITFGLSCVLSADSRLIVDQSKINYMHLIGDKSQLVNISNATKSLFGQLLIVPNSGMRVLQNNLSFCVDPIRNYLKGIS